MSKNPNATPEGPHTRRLGRIWLWAVVGIVSAVIMGLPLYVWPPSDSFAHADVAYVIGPPTRERVSLAERLLAEGVVDAVLVSVPERGGQSARQLSVCARDDVTCETPEPLTTKGEVALLTEYRRSHPADRVIVITFAPHVARTRYIFETCYDGEVATTVTPTRLNAAEWAYQYVYQTAAFVKAAMTTCASTTPD